MYANTHQSIQTNSCKYIHHIKLFPEEFIRINIKSHTYVQILVKNSCIHRSILIYINSHIFILIYTKEPSRSAGAGGRMSYRFLDNWRIKHRRVACESP